MDALTLAAVLADLTRLTGEKVRAVHSAGRLGLRLQFRVLTFHVDVAPGADGAWLTADRRSAAAELADVGAVSHAVTVAFAEAARAGLDGAELTGVAMPGGDRVARLDFTTRRFGERRRHALIFEFMGKHGNAFLLGDEDRIVMAAREMNETKREMGIGEPWRPFGGRRPLWEITAADLPEGGSVVDFKALGRRFAGLHPELAESLAAIPAAVALQMLQAIGRFYTTFDRSQLPAAFDFDASAVQVTAAVARRAADRLRAILAPIEAKLRRTRQFLELARADAERAEGFDRFRLQADLLLTHADRIVLSTTEDRAAVPDYDGTPVEIALDPRFDLRGNRERLYRKYKRLKKTRAAALARIAELEREITRLETARAAAERGEAVVEAPLKRRGVREPVRVKKKPAKPGQAVQRHVIEERTEDGHVLYIGKHARGNDYVTTKLARPWDYWFHAKEVRGSHVVLRVERDEAPPEGALREAALAAAFHSEMKNASRILVSVARRRDIRKVPGVPGLVIVHKEETLLVEQDAGPVQPRP